jgi:membrane protein
VSAPGVLERAERVWTYAWARLRKHPVYLWLEAVTTGFVRDDCMVRASALTFSTSLALVPLLAVVLAILQGAGFAEYLRPFLLERAPMLDEATVDALLQYIDRANTQAIGGVGFAALLITTWSMLSGIESSLNHILGVTTSRGYLQRAGEYLGMVVGGAVLVVLSIAAQTVLEHPPLIRAVLGDEIADVGVGLAVKLLPWGLVWVAFALLYAWMPHAKLRLSEVVLGGLLGGSLFQLVQLGYLELQVGFARYHAIYGAIAQLPILLVWIYFSWAVALLGGEAVAALRRVRGALDAPLDPHGEHAIAFLVLRAVYDAFERGESTPDAATLAARLDLRVYELREAVEPLVRTGILVEADEAAGYLPSSAAGAVPLERVLAALRS